MPAQDPQLLKGVLPLVLLQVVADREDYGYSLVVRLQEHGLAELREGSVYPALTRLEAQGLLGSRLVRSTSGPARKYYGITAAGRVDLARGLDAWHGLVDVVHRITTSTATATATATAGSATTTTTGSPT